MRPVNLDRRVRLHNDCSIFYLAEDIAWHRKCSLGFGSGGEDFRKQGIEKRPFLRAIDSMWSLKHLDPKVSAID
jgi:hypothetical protein